MRFFQSISYSRIQHLSMIREARFGMPAQKLDTLAQLVEIKPTSILNYNLIQTITKI
jgi:hypothetical protein